MDLNLMNGLILGQQKKLKSLLAVFDLPENKHTQYIPNVPNWELIYCDG